MSKMTAKEIFQIWAPTGKKWVDWVRPVPFVAMGRWEQQYSFTPNAIPPINAMDAFYADAAIIVDLPGAESVEEGIALARVGYRPIPIFNGTIEQPGARATVDNRAVAVALCLGAEELRATEIKDGALPAFLTDSNRMNRFKMEDALFDNSWDVYPQDLPTADYFLSQGIRKIVVVGESISKDLKKILYEFQKKKIDIYLTRRYDTVKKVTLRPSHYKN